jgi:hypothetical protein
LKVTVDINRRKLISLQVESSHLSAAESVVVYTAFLLMAQAVPHTNSQLETEADIIPTILDIPQLKRLSYKVGR